MVEDLPRGYEIRTNLRVRKSLCSGHEWRILSTSDKGYALVVTYSLFSEWSHIADISFFSKDERKDSYIYTSDSEYLISSLVQGPFPNNSNQIIAFSNVFGKFRENYPHKYFTDAIYLEEYGLLLPTDSSDDVDSIPRIYGKWLTGGVAIPGNDVVKIGAFLSWMPKDVLEKSICSAHIIEKSDIETKKTVKTRKTTDSQSDSLPDNAFHLIGRPDLESFFNDNIIELIRNENEYKRMGLNFPGATILYGPPGCGKTYAVDRLAEYLNWPRFNIEAGTVASPYIHDTSKKISEVFSQAIAAAPSILVIDEMEAFLSDRANAGTTAGHHLEEVGEFLRRIPEAIENHVLIFAMTNMIDQIDPAILRRGRFDHIIEVKMASTIEIESLLLLRFKELPVSEDVDPHSIADKLENHPLSDVTFVIKEAGREAVKAHKEKMDKECFDKALAELPGNTKKNKRRIGF